MHWVYLMIAILMEISGTTMMKISNGFSNLGPSILMGVFYIASLSFLTLALKKIEVGTAYAILSGIGTAMIAIIGVLIFRETISWIKILSILLIIAGVAGLNLSMSHS